MVGGILCIIISIPLLFIGFIGTLGSLISPSDPATAIVMFVFFFIPSIVLMVMGVRLIKKSNIANKLKYEQMVAARVHQNNAFANGTNNNENLFNDPNLFNNTFKDFDKMMNSQSQSQGNWQKTVTFSSSSHTSSTGFNPSFNPASGENKIVDCPNCGATSTLAANEKKECEYCGSLLVYK